MLVSLLIVSSLGLSLRPHPFHVSHTKAIYNAHKKELQISTHLFIDDFEKVLNQDYGHPISLTDRKFVGKDSLISNYIENHVTIILNGEILSLKFRGAEYSEDETALWCYLSSEKVHQAKGNIVIKNDIFMEVYRDQKNIFHLKSEHDEEYLLFKTPDQLESFDFTLLE